MIYVLAACNVTWAAAAAFFVLGWRRDMKDRADRLDAREDAHRKEIAAIHLSHRQEVAALNQARMEETADLLQRIQAPEQAVATHAGADALPDPPPVNLADDEEMLQVHEERLQQLGVMPGG